MAADIRAKVQLEGEAQFKTGLANIQQQSKTLAAEMKALSSSFDKNATAQDKARAKMQVLDKQISTQQKYIDTLNQKYANQKKRLDEIGAEYEKVATEQGASSAAAQKLAQEYTRQETALSKTEETINKAQNALNKMDSELRECAEAAKGVQEPVKTLAQKFEEAGTKIKAAGDKVKAFGDGMKNAGKTLSTRVTAPIVGAFGGMVKSATDFESAFTGVRKTVDTSESNFTKLRNSIMDMSASTGLAKEEIARVMEVAGQLGVEVGKDGETMAKFTKTMVDLGQSTDLSAEEAATALARFMNVAGVSQDKVDRLGAVLVDLGNNFATTEPEVMELSQRLASAGTMAGLSAADIMGLSAAMSSVGVTADAGGTAMSKALRTINDAVIEGGEGLDLFAERSGMSSDEFAKAWKEKPVDALQAFLEGLKKVNDEGGSVRAVLEELGISDTRQIDTLSRLALNYKGVGEAVEIANDAYKENSALTTEAEKRYATTANQMAAAKEQVKNLAVTFGEILIPYITKAIDKISPLVEKFKNMDKSQQELILKIAAVVAAVGPVLFVIGQLTSGVGAIMQVGGRLAKGVSKFPDGLNKISAIGKAFPEMIGKVGTAFKAMGTAIMAHPVIAIVAVLAGVAAYLVHLYKTNETFRNKVNKVLDTLKQKWNEFKTAFFAVVEAIKAKLDEWKAKFDAVKAAITTAMNNLKTAISNAVNAIKAAFDAFKAKVQTVVNNITTAFNNMKAGIQSAINNVKAVIQTMADKVNAVKQSISNAINAIKGFFSGLKLKIPTPDISAVTAIKDKIKGVIDKIKNFFTNLKLKIPKPSLPALPHFSVSWKTLKVGKAEASIPTIGVKWYDKGGIFNSPSIIGVGEKRPEFVGALDDLRKIVREETGGTTINMVINGAEGQDVRVLADLVYNRLNTQLRREAY